MKHASFIFSIGRIAEKSLTMGKTPLSFAKTSSSYFKQHEEILAQKFT